MSILFPIGSEWHWGTFVLYVCVAIAVAMLCRQGAIYRAQGMKVGPLGLRTKMWSNLCYTAALVILVLLGSLRSMAVGPDTYVYVGRFEQAELSFDLNLFLQFRVQELGFQLYLYIMHLLTSNYSVFFFVTYLIIGAAYITYIRYYFDEKSDYIFLQIFIFFYVHNMSSMRSAMGTVFVFLSLITLDKEQYKRSVLLTFLGTLFHYTMLYNLYIIGAVWLLRNKKLLGDKIQLVSKWWVWVAGVLAVSVLAYVGMDLMYKILSAMKYGYYLPDPGELSFLGSLFYVIFGFFALLFMKRILSDGDKSATALLVSLCMLLTYPVIYITAAYRIPYYYALPRFTVWSKVVNIVEEWIGNRRWMKIGMKAMLQFVVVLYLLFRFTRMANDGSFQYVLK